MQYPTPPPGRPHNAASAPNSPNPGPEPPGTPSIGAGLFGELGPARGQIAPADHLYKVKESASGTPSQGGHRTPPPDLTGALNNPLEPLRLDGEAWVLLLHLLLTRSGGRCEVRSPACLAPSGELHWLTRDHVSLHHRQPRGAGGTSRYDVPGVLPEVVRPSGFRPYPKRSQVFAASSVEQLPPLSHMGLLCGTGTIGCHGWVEDNRALALMFGWLVPLAVPGRESAATDPDQVVAVLPTRERVLLHPSSPVYLDAPDGMRWAA